MEIVKLPIHKHPLLPISRFSFEWCSQCRKGPVYGGYQCNELGCSSVFHRECAELLPKINHSSHPDHLLKLFHSKGDDDVCSLCRLKFKWGYICSICDFKLDFRCALIRENPNLYKHREANHTSHPQHPLEPLAPEATPDYVDKNCLLCWVKFNNGISKPQQLHHCNVCNFSICGTCNKYPPPVRVESHTTHEHELHLVPRRIDFTCNACGTLGDRSPYFCLQCNFMIHRECIDLPRVININHHDHRISYTRRLGNQREWECKVCRKKVDGFYGAYTCGKCPSFTVHSRCATRWEVWDEIELEGMPEEEEIPPFEVIDDNTIKHFIHDHTLLRSNHDDHDRIQHENLVCVACGLQILSESFYSCEQCNFIIHENCANHPRKKRHVISSLSFTLLIDSRHKVDICVICMNYFTDFRYENIKFTTIDVRCAAISNTLEHGSHQHPLYYCGSLTEPFNDKARKPCSRCGKEQYYQYSCDECGYTLDGKCAQFPKKLMRNRYDDHPLFLSFGDMNVSSDYWCESKVNPKEWFYTCNDCGTTLHISCVVDNHSYVMPGSYLPVSWKYDMGEVVSNTSICRPICSVCKSRCRLPSILKTSKNGVDKYFCSSECNATYNRECYSDYSYISE